MIGAIIGDIVGSRFEFRNTDRTNFKLFTKECDFTDDTICTIAVADAIMSGASFQDKLREWCHKYPNPMGAYGGSFDAWLRSPDPRPYNSYGNGAAMRVSPCAYAATDESEAIRLAIDSASCTHNHAEGIIGAVATTRIIRAYRTLFYQNVCKTRPIQPEDIIETYYGEDWCKRLPKRGVFDVTCQGCVPLAFYIVERSANFEEAIRQAVAYGGDSDTLAAIVGSMAEAMWGVPDTIFDKALEYLPDEMREVVLKFYSKYREFEYVK